MRVARVQRIDLEGKAVTLDDEALPYDTLLYALGSTVDGRGVPGVAERAFHVASRAAAVRLRARLDGLGAGGRVLVVGEGLTGIETATEIAENRPGLRVAPAVRGEPGAWMPPGARLHLRRASTGSASPCTKAPPSPASRPTGPSAPTKRSSRATRRSGAAGSPFH
ncbi:FAD-dependent oxidoreductase [Actinocorallia aurea]